MFFLKGRTYPFLLLFTTIPKSFILSKVSFNNKSNPFFKSLKNRVDQYFLTENTSATGNMILYIKSIILVSSALGLYISIVFLKPDSFLSNILWGLLGANLAAIGFNIMHEGGHQSFSKNKWINKISAYVLNVLGGNAMYWKIKHNINHHTFTNIEGHDSDIDIRPFMRTNPEQKKYWIHQFQYLYCLFLYGLSYFSWIFIDDFTKYFTGKIAFGHEAKNGL